MNYSIFYFLTIIVMLGLKWWGYLHTDGSIKAKRYSEEYGKTDIEDANESPFVDRVYGPFEASNRDEAIEILSDYFSS